MQVEQYMCGVDVLVVLVVLVVVEHNSMLAVEEVQAPPLPFQVKARLACQHLPAISPLTPSKLDLMLDLY